MGSWKIIATRFPRIERATFGAHRSRSTPSNMAEPPTILPGGWGIVFDDVAAGLYAWGIAALLRIWF